MKESPFRIAKSARKSRSPAVSSTGSRRISSRLTPKVRLRHDNSQIQFEPIVSSPTNPFVQESQVLTERQKEMAERQRVTKNIFSDLGSTPRQESSSSVPHPQLQLDASTNELPTKITRTPMRTRSSLGPMDVFIGSSPTPQVRKRSQQVVRDESSVTTPNAVRIVRLANDMEELGSSPPRFDKNTRSNAVDLMGNDTTMDIAADSFEYGQPSRPYSASFDDGTTIEDDVLPEAQLVDPLNDEDGSEDELPTEIGMTDLPSSTVGLQLTAQLDAELNMQDDIIANEQFREESNNLYVDAPSQQLPPNIIEAPSGTDAEVRETQLDLSGTSTKDDLEARSSNTSRVGDSFSSQVATEDPSMNYESPIQNVRRSSRNAGSSPHVRSSAKKRKQNNMDIARKAKVSKKEVQNQSPQSDSVQNEEDEGESIVGASTHIQASPQTKRGSKRKSAGSSQSPASSHFIIPETTRRGHMLRSTSLLSQVETHSEDDLVEDTPVPKRARRGVSKDVSDAKTNPEGSRGSSVKRLSHVQVSPKSSSSLSSLPSSSARKISTVISDIEVNTVDQTPSQQDEVMHDEAIPKEATYDEALWDLAIDSIKQENADEDAARQLQLDTIASLETGRSQPQEVVAAVTTPSRSFAERVILTPRSIMDQLKGVRDLFRSYKDMMLGKPEERELDDLLFDIRTEVHAAGRRGQGQ